MTHESKYLWKIQNAKTSCSKCAQLFIYQCQLACANMLVYIHPTKTTHNVCILPCEYIGEMFVPQSNASLSSNWTARDCAVWKTKMHTITSQNQVTDHGQY